MKQNMLAIVITLLMVMAFGSSQIKSQSLNSAIEEALKAGDTTSAIELLKTEIKGDPSYFYNHYILGKIYYDQQNFSDARVELEISVNRKKKFYEASYYLGRILVESGELELAKKMFETGLKKTKSLKSWFENGLGLIALKNEQYGVADRHFRRALAENETYQNKQLKDLKSAPHSDEDREIIKEKLLTRIATENGEYHINLGDANYYQGVPALAILEYEKALAVDTGSTDVYFHWADACLDMKDYTCAMDKLKLVLSKDSMHAEAWNKAGGIYYKAARSSRSRKERKARYIDAIGSYKKYLELSGVSADSMHIRPYYESAMAYSGLYRFDDAVPLFEKVLAVPIFPKDIYFYYGKSLWGTKQYDKASVALLNHIDWVAEQSDRYKSSIDESEFNRILGDSYFYRKPKDFNSAVKWYKISLEAKPGQKRLLQNTAIAYHNLQRYSDALEYYELRIAEGLDSNAVGLYKSAGRCALAAAGEQEEEGEEMIEEEEGMEDTGSDIDYYAVAIDYLDKYLEFNPSDTTILLRIANTYLYLQDCAKSIAAFERLLVVTPDNCQAKKTIGYAYFGGACKKNYSKALKHLRAAYKCVSESEGACGDPGLVKAIAQAYHLRAVEPQGTDSNSDYKNAYEWYGKVLKCDPNDAEAKKGQGDTRFEFN